MGSIDNAISSYGPVLRKHDSMAISSSHQAHSDGFHAFNIDGLKSQDINTPTGIREEILLLAWSLVLSRTREDGQVNFAWDYKHQNDGFEHGSMRKELVMSDVVSGQQDSIGQISQSISRYISNMPSEAHTQSSTSLSLLLSTGALFGDAGEARKEVS